MKVEITREKIENQVQEWVNNNLGIFSFREHQLEYIVNIIYSILNNNHVNLVEAPTGSGKSIMVIIMAGVLNEYYEKSSYILCSDLYLWDQYSKAIDKYKLQKFGRIKGMRANYICDETDEDIIAAPCRLAIIPFTSLGNRDWALKNNWPCAISCKYVRERFRAINSGVTLMTYQLWFEYMMICNGTYGSDSPFKKRQIIFCDECHKVPSLCQEARAICVDLHTMLNETNEIMTYCKETDFLLDHLEFMRDVDIDRFLREFKDVIEKLQNTPKEQQEEICAALEEYQEYVSSYPVQCYNAMRTLYETLAKENPEQKPKLSKKEFRIFNLAKKMDAHMCDIGKYFKMVNLMSDEYANDPMHTENPEHPYGVRYIVKTDNKVKDAVTGKMEWPENPIITLKFAKEDYLVYDTLITPSPFVVMLSATIGGHSAFDENIGTKYTIDKKTTMFRIPSTFDFSASPIYYIHGHKMSKEFINENFPINASIINKILKSDKHKDEKGIIHTGSYKNAWDLFKLLDKDVQDRAFIYNDSKEKKDILKKYAKSKNGVLIGPTLTEGIDLPNDGCRFIIIFKIPYPYLGDELVKAKVSLFPKWYNSETSKSIIQGVGRGNRTPTDWSTTYILDGCFARLYEETREQYAPEFRERIKLLNS